MDAEPKLLNQKALAASLGVSRDWILAMKYQGFVMPGGRALRADAVQWLKDNPHFKPGARRAKQTES